MVYLRKAQERGTANLGSLDNGGWLDSRHSFSFGSYYDPAHMGFGVLRVINDDRIAGGAGFGTHGHRDMEIISYPIEGALEHKDSLGNGSIVRPGEVQRMSAGTGVLHSEFNPLPEQTGRFLQIWILPARQGIAPSYQQREFPYSERSNRLTAIVSGSGQGNALAINQAVELYAGLLEPNKVITYTPEKSRSVWIQVASGAISVNGQSLVEGDGLGLPVASELSITGVERADFLLFELPPVQSAVPAN